MIRVTDGMTSITQSTLFNSVTHSDFSSLLHSQEKVRNGARRVMLAIERIIKLLSAELLYQFTISLLSAC